MEELPLNLVGFIFEYACSGLHCKCIKKTAITEGGNEFLKRFFQWVLLDVIKSL